MCRAWRNQVGKLLEDKNGDIRASAAQALQIMETPLPSPTRSFSVAGDAISLQSSPSSPQRGGGFSELRSSLVGLQSHPVGADASLSLQEKPGKGKTHTGLHEGGCWGVKNILLGTGMERGGMRGAEDAVVAAAETRRAMSGLIHIVRGVQLIQTSSRRCKAQVSAPDGKVTCSTRHKCMRRHKADENYSCGFAGLSWQRRTVRTQGQLRIAQSACG